MEPFAYDNYVVLGCQRGRYATDTLSGVGAGGRDRWWWYRQNQDDENYDHAGMRRGR